MLLLKNRFIFTDGLEIWWPHTTDEVLRLLQASPVVTVMLCTDQMAEALQPYAFRSRAGYTLVIDLSVPEEQLWAGLSGQSCRHKISKAQRLGCKVVVNQDGEEAFGLINRFIERRNYRHPLTEAEWQRELEHGDLFVAKHDEKVVAAHVALVNPPHSVRLLHSATADAAGHLPQKVLNVANRYLHWFEILYYKDAGIAWYDFGGLDLDTRASTYHISQFKLSFGGQILGQNSLRLARNRGLRLALRQFGRVKSLLSRVSYPYAMCRRPPPQNIGQM
jgi:hypothetical protein